MITMQPPSAGSLLPIPVLFSIMGPSAARYGHRTPEPHDRPAALPSKVHGANRYGAVALVSFLLSPFVADRLKYGIQLSAAIDVFGRFNRTLSGYDDTFSEKFHLCYEKHVPSDWIDNPEKWWPKIYKAMNTRFSNISDENEKLCYIFREFCGPWHWMRKEILDLLSLGELEACGRKKTADGPFSIIELSLFGPGSEIKFRERRLTIGKLPFYDVRIASHSGLPIHCAMLAYGQQQQVRNYLGLSRIFMRGKEKEKYQLRFDEALLTLQQDIFALLHEGHLRAITAQGQHPIEAGAWKSPQVNMEASAIRDADGTWQEFRVLSPLAVRKHPDLLEWRPVSAPSQKPALPAPALEPSGKPVFQASDDSLIQFAVDEDKRRAENGEDLLDMRERLLFLQKYRPKLSENHLRTKLMPQIRERAKRENVHLRGQGHIKQRFIK
ncbi:hypothetical protein HK16_13525 [Acetobacter senegalensis]|uniref:Uncharacterized protein n=2 Tax=Acetobacter TaxID=434 RepID=A0A252EHP3_9PROT|nr:MULTISPECIES: hypothetical protein [Acetobacter]ATJ89975.1 hypothetical protein CIW82_03975 [Acetobacter tropicalis]KAA8383969.1 hypothetical protein FOH22_15605 [Acetobacter tropicalis]KAA8386115.1 hypothetical protein FOH24_15390 [Acetobacter tropicalis]KGB24747.1 hypothetical protein AtDm6_1060 [Acetobacter tropicalis]MBC9007455.1 hypothetical protein [Acetobacter tropicalis]